LSRDLPQQVGRDGGRSKQRLLQDDARRRRCTGRAGEEVRAAASMDLLLGAFALLLVIEGLLTFFSPCTWRRDFVRALPLSDSQIRCFGWTTMRAGALLLVLYYR